MPNTSGWSGPFQWPGKTIDPKHHVGLRAARVGSPALSDGDPVISKTGLGSTRQRAQRDLGNPFELRAARPARRLDRHTFQHR
jgi:hypothetical protein